jgi:hypothetical protein
LLSPPLPPSRGANPLPTVLKKQPLQAAVVWRQTPLLQHLLPPRNQARWHVPPIISASDVVSFSNSTGAAATPAGSRCSCPRRRMGRGAVLLPAGAAWRSAPAVAGRASGVLGASRSCSAVAGRSAGLRSVCAKAACFVLVGESKATDPALLLHIPPKRVVKSLCFRLVIEFWLPLLANLARAEPAGDSGGSGVPRCSRSRGYVALVFLVTHKRRYEAEPAAVAFKERVGEIRDVKLQEAPGG